MPTKEEAQPQQPQAEPEAKPDVNALQALVTLFTIYQLREHRGENNNE